MRLRRFVDGIVSNHSGPSNFVFDSFGNRIEGAYHKLRQDEHSAIEAEISFVFRFVIADILSNVPMHSVGTYISVEGAGRGQCVMIAKNIGPFQ